MVIPFNLLQRAESAGNVSLGVGKQLRRAGHGVGRESPSSLSDEGIPSTLPWFHGSNGPIGHRRLPQRARHEPFTPRLPRTFHERPALMALVLAASGIASSWVIVAKMGSWPAWMIFPSIAGAIFALSATVVGMGLLVVLGLQPILGSRDLKWDADPLAVLGLPLAVQKKCESLGFWTCESIVASIEKRRFPWIALEYDERMQVERAVSRWHAVAHAREDTDSRKRA